jgi:hypothetical protein
VVSKARAAFDDNCKDIDKLLDVHGDVTGTNRGQRYGLEVLNKSCVRQFGRYRKGICCVTGREAQARLPV